MYPFDTQSNTVQEGKWLPIIEEVFGCDYELQHKGIVVTEGGGIASDQALHPDTPFVSR